MIATLIRVDQGAVKNARKERTIVMYILAPNDVNVVGDYTRAHYSCLVTEVAGAGVDIPDSTSLQTAVTDALNFLVIGDSSEELFASVDTPCRFCGEGDRPPSRMDRNFEGYYANQDDRKGEAGNA